MEQLTKSNRQDYGKWAEKIPNKNYCKVYVEIEAKNPSNRFELSKSRTVGNDRRSNLSGKRSEKQTSDPGIYRRSSKRKAKGNTKYNGLQIGA